MAQRGHGRGPARRGLAIIGLIIVTLKPNNFRLANGYKPKDARILQIAGGAKRLNSAASRNAYHGSTLSRTVSAGVCSFVNAPQFQPRVSGKAFRQFRVQSCEYRLQRLRPSP